MPETATVDANEHVANRWFIGIGVGEYADETLNLDNALGDVTRISGWFVQHPRVQHQLALTELSDNPTWQMMLESLRTFLKERTDKDAVIIYVACHGEFEDDEAYLLGKNSDRQNLVGVALPVRQLGQMLGASQAHNVLLIVDTCVAGSIAASIADATQLVVRKRRSIDPYRSFAHVIIASTYGLDPAIDGAFANAFLKAVSDERWTGTVRPWIGLEQMIQGINSELSSMANGQRVECTQWYNGEIALLPNPNLKVADRRGAFDEAEFAAHFDPAARGVSRSETGSFFTGRTQELRLVTSWLEPSAEYGTDARIFVITGSPGSGKSALLSRIAVLSLPVYWPDGMEPGALPDGTVPPAGSLDGVVWCHGKNREQIVAEISGILGGAASTTEGLLSVSRRQGRNRTIAIDALDEAAAGEAPAIVNDILIPLTMASGVRLLVGSRKHSIDGGDLVDPFVKHGARVLDLDDAADHAKDIKDYVRRRLAARSIPLVDPLVNRHEATDALAAAIAKAAGNSFLVASIAASGTPTLAAPSSTYKLPVAVGEALAAYLDRFDDADRIRAVLRPLAWAQGAGQPWGTVWPALATALADNREQITDVEVKRALEAASDLVVEADDRGEPVYRLFHAALAEYFRDNTPDTATVPRQLAEALLGLATGRPWPTVPRYCRNYLPALLAEAGMVDVLAHLMLDPAWERQQRSEAGMARDLTRDVETAADVFADRERALDLAPLCHQYARARADALPPLIEVLALSGQQRRAEALAANLTDVPDRMLAYRGLARIFAADGDQTAALRCAHEVRRTQPAMPLDHMPMAYAWACEAFVQGGSPVDALSCAREASLAVPGNDRWDRLNGLFWAAMAARSAGDESLRGTIALAVEKLGADTFRNQGLQAAAVAGCDGMLREILNKRLQVAPSEPAAVRIGNLGLAIADAQLWSELDRLVAYMGSTIPNEEDDSIKRWIWALALSGRHSDSVSALSRVGESVERSKAIARIAPLVAASTDKGALARLREEVVTATTGMAEPRTMARLVRALWTVGLQEEALAAVEREIERGGFDNFLVDRRAEEMWSVIDPESAERKTVRRAMTTSRAPVADQMRAMNAVDAAIGGEIDKARALISGIHVPRFKAQALTAIANHDPDPAKALVAWFDALIAARRAGRGEVEKILPHGPRLLRNAGHAAQAEGFDTRLADIDAQWQLESFVDEYSAIRRSMVPGHDRTRLMTNLLLSPRRLAKTRVWSIAEIQAAWDRAEDGSRLFVLGLMQGNPDFIVSEIAAEAIRLSRSAFEQYAALKAVILGLDTRPVETVAIQAIRDEIAGVPRLNGARAWMEEGSSRRQIGQTILDETEKRQSELGK